MMPSIKESEFWQQAKAGLTKFGAHASRIENTAGTGISDVNACFNGVEVWIELKVVHADTLHFRNSQRIWILDRVAHGGRVFVLSRGLSALYLYSGGPVMRAPHTSHGVDKKSFHVKLKDLPTHNYFCSKPFDWGEVCRHLFDT